jgi:hypothetical protein
MPKEGTMAQLSRPFQVALAAIVLLAAVWFVALRGHSSTSGTSSSAPASEATVPAPKAAKPSTPYHGPAPGVAGLTRDIEKARGAVSASEQNARQLEHASERASANAASPSSAATSGGTPATRWERSSSDTLR